MTFHLILCTETPVFVSSMVRKLDIKPIGLDAVNRKHYATTGMINRLFHSGITKADEGDSFGWIYWSAKPCLIYGTSYSHQVFVHCPWAKAWPKHSNPDSTSLRIQLSFIVLCFQTWTRRVEMMIQLFAAFVWRNIILRTSLRRVLLLRSVVNYKNNIYKNESEKGVDNVLRVNNENYNHAVDEADSNEEYFDIKELYEEFTCTLILISKHWKPTMIW